MAEPLGDLQLQVMEIIWRRGRASVADVHAELAGRRKIAYTTVLTTLRALERRGMVVHEQVGKAYVYQPAVDRPSYAAATVEKLVDDLFAGQKEQLLCHLLGKERIGPGELEEIRRLLAAGKTRGDQ